MKSIEHSGTEWITLKNIQYDVNQDNLVLYIHTKVVTRYNTTELKILFGKNGESKSFTLPLLYDNIQNWRDLIKFLLVYHYKSCLEIFTENRSIDTIEIN